MNQEINISPIISPPKATGRFNNVFQGHDLFNSWHLHEFENFQNDEPHLFHFLPSPLDLKYTAEVLKDKKSKVREVMKFPNNSSTSAFYAIILDYIFEANQIYNFDFNQILPYPNIVKLPHTDSVQDWNWNLDQVESKLTIICQLSDPKDYKGGDHLIRLGSNVFTLPKEQFKTVVFPSFGLQKLEPITKGSRKYFIAHIGSHRFE